MRVLVSIFLGALAASFIVAVPASAATDSKLVLVLDSSGSMKEEVGGQSKISIAKASLRTVIGKLPADAPVGLRVYGATVFDKQDKGACTDSQLVVPIGTDNRAAMRTEIARYKPYGETPISYSLIQAAKDLGQDGKRSILLVSDGEETCNADPCKTAAAITKNNIKVKIDVVGLAVSGQVRSKLQCIAEKGNGSYYDADSRDDLEDSLDKLATRALRPFRVTGTPIQGSTDKSKAPTIGPGQYVDKVRERDTSFYGKKIYYRIPHALPGSTITVGFNALVTTQRRLRFGTVNLHLYDTGGSLCGTSSLSQGISVVGGTPLVGAESDSWEAGGIKHSCNTDELLLEIYTADLIGRRFELVVSEEPPVSNADDLPGPAPRPGWKAMSGLGETQKVPVPGTSFSDAAPLTQGVYRGRILTGENQVFAVNADWGQRVQVEVDIPPRKGALARALSVSERLDLQLFAPRRGEYRRIPATGMPLWDSSLGADDRTYRQGRTTPTIRYNNRTNSDDSHLAMHAGPQYVALDMSHADNDRRFLVPYTLKVKVIGAAGTGTPTYVEPATPTPTPTPTTPPTATPSPVPTNTDGPGTGVSFGLTAGVGLGAVLLGVAGTLLVLRLRRRKPTIS